ncbi:MAG: hypothetical protein A2048_05865 [Deltaproteobacteria bacterium GWA2_45_12]|nr:MAG: hypothetical protein A2048_05865 [Deltaproteobacteria bacterium GWA2_45_12]
MGSLPHTSVLPELIASLNGVSFLCLIAGFILIKFKRIFSHRVLMSVALVSSGLFLVVYLMHHYQVGSVPYGRHDWTRVLYFIILVPHIILAVGMLPFIYLAVRAALKNEIEKHKRIVRFLFPVWTYVSFTGLVVYFMLYHLE